LDLHAAIMFPSPEFKPTIVGTIVFGSKSVIEFLQMNAPFPHFSTMGANGTHG